MSTIAYVSVVSFILACRYLPALRWTFRFLYVLLGRKLPNQPIHKPDHSDFVKVTAITEAVGKLVFSQGVASTFRPKRYYTIPREALEASLEDVEQLINFFVIEFQRILFAENVTVTFAACAAAFISYWLIKIVPVWGLSLIGSSVGFLGPLIYINNRELIDHHIANAQEIANAQAVQAKDLVGQHTSQYSQTVKQYAGDYTAKAQEYIGNARRPEPAVPSTPKPMTEAPVSSPGSGPKYEESDFPHAPKQAPVPGIPSPQEKYEKSQFGGQAVPAT